MKDWLNCMMVHICDKVSLMDRFKVSTINIFLCKIAFKIILGVPISYFECVIDVKISGRLSRKGLTSTCPLTSKAISLNDYLFVVILCFRLDVIVNISS